MRKSLKVLIGAGIAVLALNNPIYKTDIQLTKHLVGIEVRAKIPCKLRSASWVWFFKNPQKNSVTNQEYNRQSQPYTNSRTNNQEYQ